MLLSASALSLLLLALLVDLLARFLHEVLIGHQVVQLVLILLIRFQEQKMFRALLGCAFLLVPEVDVLQIILGLILREGCLLGLVLVHTHQLQDLLLDDGQEHHHVRVRDDLGPA